MVQMFAPQPLVAPQIFFDLDLHHPASVARALHARRAVGLREAHAGAEEALDCRLARWQLQGVGAVAGRNILKVLGTARPSSTSATQPTMPSTGGRHLTRGALAAAAQAISRDGCPARDDDWRGVASKLYRRRADTSATLENDAIWKVELDATHGALLAIRDIARQRSVLVEDDGLEPMVTKWVFAIEHGGNVV